jgi:homoserine O-acetyltransferase
MVRAERALLDQLGVERLLAVTGGSLGGMQALAWAVAYPDDVRAIIPIATTAHLGAQGLAWNAIARSAIMADPDWQGGRYYGTARAPRAGIGVARMVGHVTYLSKESMTAKFGRRLQSGDDLSFDVTGADYAVESYLRHQASTFAARFDANSYLYLSRALTYFDLARDYGQGSLERALAGLRARTLLISYSSDWLYPPADSAEIAEALRAVDAEVESCLLETSYGHDSFLLEEARQTPVIADFLARCR